MQSVGARSGVLRHLLQKVSRLPSICPLPQPLYPSPIHFFLTFLSPSVRTPNSPTILGAQRPPFSPQICPGPLLPEELQQAKIGRGDAASQESRVCSPSLAAHPGDPERHGFLCTRQQLSGEKQSTGAPDQPGTLNPPQASSRSSAARREESGPA